MSSQSSPPDDFQEPFQGRGIDALFSPLPPAPSPGQADEDAILAEMLQAEMDHSYAHQEGERLHMVPPQPDDSPDSDAPLARPSAQVSEEEIQEENPAPTHGALVLPAYDQGEEELAELGMDPGEAASIQPQSPFIRPQSDPVPDPIPPPRTPQEEAEILAQIDQKRLAELHEQIDTLYRDVPRKISNRPDETEQILDMLRQARMILLETPEDFVIAEYKVQQALSLYNRIENAEKWGDTYGWRVFWFEVIVFVLFLTSFLVLLGFSEEISAYLASLLGTEDIDKSILTAVGFWGTLVWGGIGGVVGALYILWTHVSERQDFERQHVMWYIAQPIMGLILGGVIFLIISAGLLSLQGGQVAAAALRSEVQFFPALLAFIAGFRPQFVFGLLMKIINLVTPSESRANETAA